MTVHTAAGEQPTRSRGTVGWRHAPLASGLNAGANVKGKITTSGDLEAVSGW